MLIAPVAHIDAIRRDHANRLLLAWGHRMGAVNRPVYAIDASHALFHHGEPVAVAVAGDTVREVVGQTGIRRDQCIELVRLCAARRDLCRPMLRLWRELIYPQLATLHRRQVAVSYQDEALHSGDLYRFDGWADLGRAGGGGRDQRTGRAGRRMKVWGWPAALALTLAASVTLAEPVHVDAVVVIDGQALHLPAAICTLDEPAVYSREDGRLTLRIAGVTCTDRLFRDGFDSPARVPAWKEPR